MKFFYLLIVLAIVGTAFATNFGTSSRIQQAFAALKNDGTVVAWGSSNFGGSTSGVTGLENVQTIFSSYYSFAALKTDAFSRI